MFASIVMLRWGSAMSDLVFQVSPAPKGSIPLRIRSVAPGMFSRIRRARSNARSLNLRLTKTNACSDVEHAGKRIQANTFGHPAVHEFCS